MNNIKSVIISVATAIIIFLILSITYMSPTLDNKTLKQGDVMQHTGMSRELVKYREKTGKEALWTNSMFGGMPAYMISTRYTSNLLRVFHDIFILHNWRPICFIFLYLFGAYIALLAFGVNRWLSIVGAIAYAFSSYFFIIIEAGHISKVLALGYLPPVVAGVYLAYKGKILLGGIVTGFFLSLQLLMSHPQITYYTLLIILVLAIIELIYAIRNKTLIRFIKTSVVLGVFAVLAVGSNISNLWTIYEYGKYSIRGKSELTSEKDNRTSGLDRSYITQWSYGITETFTLLIPNFKGGASGNPLPESSATYKFIKSIQGPANARQAIKQMPTYWGDQPFTSGPVYVGAIIVFLFVLGLYVIKGKIKWWIIVTTVLSIMLAWGKNLPWFTNFFLDYFPGYNKFRTVSMTLVIAEFTMPLFGILAINEILHDRVEKKVLLKYVLNSFYITGGICLFFILTAPMWFDFKAASDQQYLAQGATQFVNALRSDRLMLLRHDAFRSLIFIALATGTLYLYIKQKLSRTYFLIILGFLILVDLWSVDKRYLNDDDFVPKRVVKNEFTKTNADKYILQDTTLDYRVLNLTVSPFQDATTSYYHESIGGYHGAKMRRYQEMIDYHLQPEIQSLIKALRKGNFAIADSSLSKSSALDMLNTKYIIYNTKTIPITNDHALGNVWFVPQLQWVKNADQEIAAIGSLNPAKKAVADVRFKSKVGTVPTGTDSTSTIRLVHYQPNKLEYKSSTDKPRLAVFSEIYYPKGWKVTVDGKPASYFRADYILRAMIVPAGKHTIEFKFHPRSYYLGNKISYASSSLLLLLLLGSIVMEIKNSRKKEEKD